MRLTEIMESNRDTAGWGIIGSVWALSSASPSLFEKMMVAALVAGAGWLGSYIVKKLITYGEAKIRYWFECRKSKTNKHKELHEKFKNVFGRIGRYVGGKFKRLRTRDVPSDGELREQRSDETG